MIFELSKGTILWADGLGSPLKVPVCATCAVSAHGPSTLGAFLVTENAKVGFESVSPCLSRKSVSSPVNSWPVDIRSVKRPSVRYMSSWNCCWIWIICVPSFKVEISWTWTWSTKFIIGKTRFSRESRLEVGTFSTVGFAGYLAANTWGEPGITSSAVINQKSVASAHVASISISETEPAIGIAGSTCSGWCADYVFTVVSGWRVVSSWAVGFANSELIHFIIGCVTRTAILVSSMSAGGAPVVATFSDSGSSMIV